MVYRPANKLDEEALPGPLALEDCDQKALSAIVEKYGGSAITPLIEALVAAGTPIRDYEDHYGKWEVINDIRKRIILNKNARLQDQVKGYEVIAKLMNLFPEAKAKGTQVNIQQNIKWPQHVKDIDADIKSTGLPDE